MQQLGALAFFEEEPKPMRGYQGKKYFFLGP
jgi:hypothetical protein